MVDERREPRPASRYRSVATGEILRYSQIVYRAWKGGQHLEGAEEALVLDGEQYRPVRSTSDA